MTVAISCNLSEGVILGVDSAVTMSNQNGVVKVYENADKLFQLGEKPIGIAIFGLASLGSRSIGSYIREFEVTNPKKVVTRKNAPLQEVTECLREFFYKIYLANVVPALEKETGKKFEDIPNDQKPAFGLVVGGFQGDAYLSEVWEVIVPHHDKPDSANLKRREGDFGTNWFAILEPIKRYIKGFDEGLVNELLAYTEKLRGETYSQEELDEIRKIMQKYEYVIPYAAMPMTEGLAHVRFLVELVVNHHRFAVGAPIVGGEPRLGMVTYKGEQFKILQPEVIHAREESYNSRPKWER